MGVDDVDEAMRRAAAYWHGDTTFLFDHIRKHIAPVIAELQAERDQAVNNLGGAVEAANAQIEALKAKLAAASNSGVDEREAEMIRQDCRLEHELGKRIGELEKRIAVYEHLFPATTCALTPIGDAEATTILERHYVHKEWKLRAEELERELAEARLALKQIAEYRYTPYEVPESEWAKHTPETCPECKRWRDMNHPIQHSCDGWYRLLHGRERENKRRMAAEGYEMSKIARAALDAALTPTKGADTQST